LDRQRGGIVFPLPGQIELDGEVVAAGFAGFGESSGTATITFANQAIGTIKNTTKFSAMSA